jgi:hypothetical protein
VLQAHLCEPAVVNNEPAEEPPSEDESHAPDPFAELTEKHSDLVIEVLLRMLDWMGVCKSTWTSAEGVWDMLRSMVPDPVDYPVFSHVKAKLEEYMQGRMEIIPICVNNCMAFYRRQGGAGEAFLGSGNGWQRRALHGNPGAQSQPLAA